VIAVRLPDCLLELDKESTAILHIYIYIYIYISVSAKITSFFDICNELKKTKEGATESPYWDMQ